MRRVRYAVLVCKRWSTLCLENPAQLAETAFQLQNTSVPSYLTWLEQSSKRAEKLEITILSSGEGYPLLPQQTLNSFLVRLSNCSPLLRTLAISGPHEEDFTYQGGLRVLAARVRMGSLGGVLASVESAGAPCFVCGVWPYR